MDKSRCKEIVTDNLDEIKWELQVQQWDICLRLQAPDNPAWRACCEQNLTYNLATITLDPDIYEDSEEGIKNLLTDLKHELRHLQLSPFHLYREMIELHLPAEMTSMSNRLFAYAVEQTMQNLERQEKWGNTPRISRKDKK